MFIKVASVLITILSFVPCTEEQGNRVKHQRASRKVGQSCNHHYDCEGLYICEGKMCDDPPISRAAHRPCEENGQCYGPLVCKDGTCQFPPRFKNEGYDPM